MRKLSLSMATLGLLFSLAAPSGAEEFKLAGFVPKGTFYWKLFPQQFVEKLTIATQGEVDVKAYGAGVLAGVFEGHKAVLDGRADMAYHYGAYEINEKPAGAFIGDIPGGMGPEGKMVWLLAAGGYDLWQEYRHSQGLHGIFCGWSPSELFANSHKRVQSLDDLQGLKHRTAGANAWVMEELGASPTVVPGPEVFPVLERKAVDSAEYLDPYGNASLGFHKVAKYVIYPGIHAPGSTFELIMRKETWDSFSEDTQKAIKMVCDSVLLNSYAMLSHKSMTAMKEMDETADTELVELDPEVLQAFRKKGREWTQLKIKEEKGEQREWMQRFAESYYDYQDDWTNYSAFQVIDRD